MSSDTYYDEDIKLVELCRKGDRIAFDRLVLKYQHKVVGMCGRLLGSAQDGEDAAQECFVKVYRNIERFKGDSSFSTWLYRIAVNTCRNRHSSFWGRLTRRTVSINDDEREAVDIADTSFSPSKDLEAKQLGDAIKKGD